MSRISAKASKSSRYNGGICGLQTSDRKKSIGSSQIAKEARKIVSSADALVEQGIQMGWRLMLKERLTTSIRASLPRWVGTKELTKLASRAKTHPFGRKTALEFYEMAGLIRDARDRKNWEFLVSLCDRKDA